LRLSERRATNIGLLYPKVRNNIAGDIPVDVPLTKILGDVPGIPGGVDASAPYVVFLPRLEKPRFLKNFVGFSLFRFSGFYGFRVF